MSNLFRSTQHKGVVVSEQSKPITDLQYLQKHGGITTPELFELKKNDPNTLLVLRTWAREEAEVVGIPMEAK